jgi:hypothetical protein
MFKTNIKLLLLTTIFSTQLSLNAFAMDKGDPDHPENVIKKLAAAKNEENMREAVKKQKEKTTKDVEKYLEDKKLQEK